MYEARRFYASPVVAWLIPLLTGLTAGILVAGVVSLFAWRYMGDTKPFITFLITCVVITLIVWGWVTSWVFSKIDLGPTKPIVMKIQWEEDGRNLRFAHFESVDDKEMEKICKMVVNGGSLSIRNLRTILQRERVSAFRLDLVENRLAVFDEKNEVKLTPKGVKFVRNVAHYPTEKVEDV
jgi:hypothetical protein